MAKENLSKINEEKVEATLERIKKLEKVILSKVDDFVMECDEPISVSEIISALMSATNKMNNKQIMEMLKEV